MGKLATLTAAAPQPPAPRSAERERLAEAIERHRAASQELERVKQARQRLMYDIAIPADKALEAATDALKTMQASESRILASQFLGDTTEARALADARRAVDVAKAEVDRGSKTSEGLAEREREALAEFEKAERVLDEAHVAAVKSSPEMAALAAKHEAVKRQAAALMLVMESVYKFHPYLYPRTYDMIVTRDQLDHEQVAVEINAWSAAIAKLRENPDTELPT